MVLFVLSALLFCLALFLVSVGACFFLLGQNFLLSVSLWSRSRPDVPVVPLPLPGLQAGARLAVAAAKLRPRGAGPCGDVPRARGGEGAAARRRGAAGGGSEARRGVGGESSAL